METVDLTKVAGFKALDSDGNELGIVSMEQLTDSIAMRIADGLSERTVLPANNVPMAVAASSTGSDKMETDFSETTDPAYVRVIDKNGNSAKQGISSLASVVGELSGYSRITMKEVTIPPNSTKDIDAFSYTDFLSINLGINGGVALFIIGKGTNTKLVSTNIPDFGVGTENDISKPFYSIYVNGYAIRLYNNTDKEVTVYYRWIMIGR